MYFKTGTILLAFALGCLAIPTPEADLSPFFRSADPNNRIVGGSIAPDASHPHMTALSNGVLIRSFLCGGSVVATRTVLTAAHCIDAVYSFGSLSGSLRVTVGTNSWNQGGQTYTLSGNATHPNYVSGTIKNDIGFLYTSNAIIYTARVSPIPLSFEFAPGGLVSRVAGWGRISATGALSAQLLELVVNTVEGEQCIREVAQTAAQLNVLAPPVEPHIEICTFLQSGSGTCRGDSGSALVRLDTGAQIGVVSWGFACARGAPDMFARVSAYQSWVLQYIRY